MSLIIIITLISIYEIYLHVKTTKTERSKKETLINFYSQSLDAANEQLNKLL
jgi:hypothetical protein